MSEVYAGYNINVKNAKGDADNQTAQKIYDYCKERFDWFAEWDDGPFYIKDNVIYSDAEFGIKSAGDLLDDPMGWLRTVCEEVKPERMDVSIFTDASECGGWYMRRNITASIKDGELRVDNDLEYDEIQEYKPLLFADCDELKSFAPCHGPDSLCDNLLAMNCNTFEIDVLRLVFKNGEGEEITEPIRINPGESDDVREALEYGAYFLEQGCDFALRDADEDAVTRLADADVESITCLERGLCRDESIEFVGLKLPGIEKPIMLKAWEKKAEIEGLSEPVFGTFTDPRDGHVYKTVKLGGLEWFAENFAYKCDDSYAYDDDEKNVKKYGRLYTWVAAMKCAPEGWHLPTKNEFAQLESYVKKHTDTAVGTALKSTTEDWEETKDSPKGLDKFGFCALPAGCRNNIGNFSNLGGAVAFWSATENSDPAAFSRILNCRCDRFFKGWNNEELAFSVRLVRD